MYLLKIWNSSNQKTRWYLCITHTEAAMAPPAAGITTRHYKACWLTHTLVQGFRIID